MNFDLSRNAQAILLLTAPLIVGKRAESSPILTLTEYNRLAGILRDKQRQPADLIDQDAAEVLSLVAHCFDKQRLEQLLSRGFLLAQALDRWNTRSIWVMSRADAKYPSRLKSRLKGDAPPVLYGSGDPSLLEKGGLAVVGSRAVNDVLLEYSFEIGRIVASSNRALISGGARGVDRAAMDGASQSGGTVAGILAEGLEQAVLAKNNRQMLLEHRLLLISSYDPSAGFNVGHAMQRNKLIYACSDAALVVNAELGKGGTWTGAVEQLERFHLVPIFVRNGPNMTGGNEALLRRGAKAWPEPADGEGLDRLLKSSTDSFPKHSPQQLLSFPGNGDEVRGDIIPEPKSAAEANALPSVQQSEPASLPADRVCATVEEILRTELREPMTERQIADLLRVTLPQTRIWLKMLVAKGMLERLFKPTRYQTAANQN